jgi:hypothetical protein
MGLDARLLTLNRSQEDLEAELLLIQNELMGAKTLTHWSVGDSSAEKSIWLSQPPAVRLRLVAEALSIVNPTQYPPDFTEAVTQTRVIFG